MNKGKRAVVEKCLIKVVFQDSWQKEKASWEIRHFLTPTLCHTRGIKSSLMSHRGRTLDLTLCHQCKYFAISANILPLWQSFGLNTLPSWQGWDLILDLKCWRKLRLSLSASLAKWRLLARVQLSDLGQDMSEHGLGKVGFISCVCPLNFVKKCPTVLDY